MKVLIAIASSERQHVGALRTCYLIKTREGDAFVDEWRWRGDVAREAMVDTFIDDERFGDEDALLMLDADQRHPKDLLEKLREHDLDMVCAHYYRRGTSPVQSLCYELGDGTWPFLPFLHPPTEGMHEIAVTGFGCVLIKKKVFKAVKEMIPEGMSPVAIAPIPEIAGDHGNWGPDFRFFHLARRSGYKLWLDASIESYHAVTLWLGHKSARKLIDYVDWADAAHDLLMRRLELHGVSLEAFKQRKRILEARKQGLLQQLELAKETEASREKLEEISVALIVMDGRLLEMSAWIEWSEKYPKIKRPDQLPTTQNTPKQDTIQDELGDIDIARNERAKVYRENAVELAEMLPNVSEDGREGAEGKRRLE